ncbi:MAG: ABC transporter ATP-binding protein [Nocardioides sp.]
MTKNVVADDPPGAEEANASGLKALLWLACEHRAALVVGLLLGALGSVAALAQPLAAKRVLDAVGVDESLRGPVLTLLALVLGGALVNGVQLFVLERTGEKIVYQLRRNLIARLLRLRMSEYDRRSVGDLLSRAGSDTTLLRSVVTANVLDAVSSVILLVGAIAVMAYLDWVQLAVVLGVLVVVFLGVLPLLGRIRTATEAAQEGIGQMTSSLERALGAIRTVKASVREEQEIQAIGERAREAYVAGVRSVKLDATVGVGTGLAVQMSFLLVLGVGGLRVAAGAISASDLIAFLLYILYLASPIMVISNAVSQLQKASAAADRVMAVESMEIEEAPRTTKLPDAARTEPPTVSLQHVRFAYRPDVPVLRDVSFDLPAGCKAALVGPSGAGKTTILGLLERFYDPDAGRILLDGQDIAQIPINELRRQIGYVEQSAPVLAGTLRENLLYTAPDTPEDRLDAVVRASQLGDLVARLPDGLDTAVGDRGSQLSGGERQRLAIGRLLLTRPRLVLLDEATSQLDSVNEAALREAISELAKSCTMIVIAHRLSTVAASDRIVLLDGGRVRRVGTHEELIADDAVYQGLARGQLLAGDRASEPAAASA